MCVYVCYLLLSFFVVFHLALVLCCCCCCLQGLIDAVPEDRTHLVQFTDCDNASTYGCCLTVTHVLQVCVLGGGTPLSYFLFVLSFKFITLLIAPSAPIINHWSPKILFFSVHDVILAFRPSVNVFFSVFVLAFCASQWP